MTIHVLLIRRETERAIQVVLGCRRRFFWLPKSSVRADVPLVAGERDFEAQIPDWLYDEKEAEWLNLEPYK